ERAGCRWFPERMPPVPRFGVVARPALRRQLFRRRRQRQLLQIDLPVREAIRLLRRSRVTPAKDRHIALEIKQRPLLVVGRHGMESGKQPGGVRMVDDNMVNACLPEPLVKILRRFGAADRKSTRLNSSHQIISYAVFCLKKKKL